MRKSLVALSLLVAAATTAPGCAVEDEVGQDVGEARELKDLYRDFRNLDLDDLLNVSAGMATDELNNVLSVSPYFELEIEPTEVYVLAEDAQNDVTAHNLDKLVSGLAEKFGEKELTTQVNAVRRRHLQSSGDDAFAESAFEIEAGLHNWQLSSGGFGDGNWSIGFTADARLQARVVSAHDSERDALYEAPLAAIKTSRGFVLPRSVEDLRGLKPGESYALNGRGRLGMNLGVGVPFLISAVDAVAYNLVVSAGMRTMLEGEIDVQVVRLEGDEIVVDVGVDKAKVKSAGIAIHDGWGVHGLIETEFQIGSLSLDIGRVVDKALQKELSKKLRLVDGSINTTTERSRLSVARFRVNLEHATPGSPVELALQQALKADIRLAQALSNRYEPGINAEFELTRSGVATTSYAGIDIFGLSFYRKKQVEEGHIVVQTPGGARSIYFDSLHKEGGSFLTKHGYGRIGLAGMRFDPTHPSGGQSEANVIYQLMEGDKKMERDKLLDHLDGIILGIGGEQAFQAVEIPGNEMERYVEEACPNSQAFDPCRIEVLGHSKVAQLMQQGEDGLAAATTHLADGPRDLVREAGKLRITGQMAYEPHAGWTGPPTTIVVDYRLDDDALANVLTQHSRADFEYAVRAYLRVSEIKRRDEPGEIEEDRADMWRDVSGAVENAGAIYADYQKRYGHALEAERLTLPAHPELGEMGPRAIEIRFPVSSGNVPNYEEAAAKSLGRARAKVATDLVDALIDELDDETSKNSEQVVAYSLLFLTPADSTDLRLDIDFDLDDGWSQSYPQYRDAGYQSLDIYAKGPAVSPIDGGLFELDELLEITD
jgi:hypothetical protein